MAIRGRSVAPRDNAAPQGEQLVTANYGQATPEGWKEAGETFHLPASVADVQARGGAVTLGDAGAGKTAEEVVVEAYRNQYDPNTVPHPEGQGQVGMAAHDQIAHVDQSVEQGQVATGRYFRDTQSDAERRFAAGQMEDVPGKVDEVAKVQQKKARVEQAGASAVVQNPSGEIEAAGYERKDVVPSSRPGERPGETKEEDAGKDEQADAGAEAAQEDEAATADEPRDYSSMKKAELEAIAKERGIEGTSNMNKQELADRLAADDRQG